MEILIHSNSCCNCCLLEPHYLKHIVPRSQRVVYPAHEHLFGCTSVPGWSYLAISSGTDTLRIGQFRVGHRCDDIDSSAPANVETIVVTVL
ncbi:MAG TPA: hypothetical protein VGE21_01190 [Flavobacteriales bacterium]